MHRQVTLKEPVADKAGYERSDEDAQLGLVEQCGADVGQYDRLAMKSDTVKPMPPKMATPKRLLFVISGEMDTMRALAAR